MDLKEEEILGDQVDAHWYYKAKKAALLRDLRGHWAGLCFSPSPQSVDGGF